MRNATEFFSSTAATLKRANVTVLGVELRIREFTHAERKAFIQAKDVNEQQLFLLKACVLSDDDNPLFGSKDDIAKLASLPPGLVDGITQEVLTLSGVKVKEKGEAADEAAGGAETPPAATTTDDDSKNA